mgnify:FL=1
MGASESSPEGPLRDLLQAIACIFSFLFSRGEDELGGTERFLRTLVESAVQLGKGGQFVPLEEALSKPQDLQEAFTLLLDCVEGLELEATLLCRGTLMFLYDVVGGEEGIPATEFPFHHLMLEVRDCRGVDESFQRQYGAGDCSWSVHGMRRSAEGSFQDIPLPDIPFPEGNPTVLHDLPHILMVHLTGWYEEQEAGGLAKSHCHRGSKYLRPEQLRFSRAEKQVFYSLEAVVMHTGFDLNNGHYFTFVLSRDVSDEPQWLVLDDHNVHCVSWDVATGVVVPDPTAVPC